MDTQGWLQALKGFAGGGLVGAGVPLPPSIASNPIQQVLQNPDNMAALGVGVGWPKGVPRPPPKGFGGIKLEAQQGPQIVPDQPFRRTSAEGPNPTLPKSAPIAQGKSPQQQDADFAKAMADYLAKMGLGQ